MASIPSRLLRWGPLAFLAMVFVALALASPETLLVTAKNPLAWLFVVVVVALSIGLTRIIGGRFGRPVLGRLVGLVPVIVALVWGFLPAFRDVEVVEAAPDGLQAAAFAPATGPSGSTSLTPPAATTSATATTPAPTTPPEATAAPTTELTSATSEGRSSWGRPGWSRWTTRRRVPRG